MQSLRRITMMFVLFFAVLNVSHAMGQFFIFENPLVGEAAPDFTLKTLKGRDKNFDKFRNDDAAILFFWATWCPHCRTQLRQLNAQGKAIERKGIRIVLVDLGEKENIVSNYMKKNDLQFDVFLDEESVVAEQYGIVGVPTFIYVDKEGIVQAIEHELLENYEEVLLGEES